MVVVSVEPYSELEDPRSAAGRVRSSVYPATFTTKHPASFPMILDDKVIMRPIFIPPPDYYSQSSPSLHTPSLAQNLSTLPPHILLQILHRTFPQSSRIPDQGTPELQRKTLYWLSTSLRLVNRALYTACMHILRSTYLRAYQALLKPPYSSDPFPISSGPPAYDADGSPIQPPQYQSIPEESPLQTIQRETLILDRFITLKVREDVFTDDSSLHLEGDDKFRDLFNLAQPQARLEDLVRICGLREGVVSVPGVPLAPPSAGGRAARLYTSSLSSTSQSSLSPFHDSNAVAVSHPISPHNTSAPTPQVASKQSSNGFLSTLRKFTSTSPSTPLSPFPLSKPYSRTPRAIQPLPFSSLSITFTFQTVRLIRKLKEDGSRKCVAEVPRNRSGTSRRETLEVLAEGLVRALKEGLEEERGAGE